MQKYVVSQRGRERENTFLKKDLQKSFQNQGKIPPHDSNRIKYTEDHVYPYIIKLLSTKGKEIILNAAEGRGSLTLSSKEPQGGGQLLSQQKHQKQEENEMLREIADVPEEPSPETKTALLPPSAVVS